MVKKINAVFKRLFPVAFSLLIILVCALPATAAEIPGAQVSNNYLVPIIPFDTIRVFGVRANPPYEPFAFPLANIPIPDQTDVTSLVQGDFMGRSLGYSYLGNFYYQVPTEDFNKTYFDVRFDFTVPLQVQDEISLYASDFILDPSVTSKSSVISFLNGDDKLIPFDVQIGLSFSVLKRPEASGDYYALETSNFNIGYYDVTQLDIYSVLMDRFNNPNYQDTVLLITDMEVVISTLSMASSDVDVSMSFVSDVVYPSSFVEWFNDQELVYYKNIYVNGSNVNVDFVGWLSTAIGSFFQFEIFPGVSIGGIFWAVVSLMLVFAFLVLLR